jgi:hypothetical protein
VAQVVSVDSVSLRLPFGSWWLIKDSKMDEFLLWQGGYWQEEAEFHFVERFLNPV